MSVDEKWVERQVKKTRKQLLEDRRKKQKYHKIKKSDQTTFKAFGLRYRITRIAPRGVKVFVGAGGKRHVVQIGDCKAEVA